MLSDHVRVEDPVPVQGDGWVLVSQTEKFIPGDLDSTWQLTCKKRHSVTSDVVSGSLGLAVAGSLGLVALRWAFSGSGVGWERVRRRELALESGKGGLPSHPM